MGREAVVSLVQAAELKSPALDDLRAHARRRAMEWYHLPIRDAATPDSEFEARWVRQARPGAIETAAQEDYVLACRVVAR